MNIDFGEITLRQQISSRGGGIEIDLSTLGFPGEKMVVYQNYLGGGLLGGIMENNTIETYGRKMIKAKAKKLDGIKEALKRYFHGLTDPGTEWEGRTYEMNQNMPESGY